MHFNCDTNYCFRYFILPFFALLYSTGSSAQLTADFNSNVSGGCSPLAVFFTNQTTNASANATYLWDFQNGNTSALPNPGAIFKDEQAYNVTLTVTDGNITSSVTKQITVYSLPLAGFTASPLKGCAPFQVNFTALPAGDGSNNFTWDFGDGNILQGADNAPSHIYSVPGIATVSLTVSNSYGCTNTSVKQNLATILPGIQASFSASQTVLCRVSDPVQFTNTSAGPGTLTWLWDFGDGDTSASIKPSHIFNVKGTYNVSLTVNSSEGCTNTSTQTGYINVADFKSDITIPSPICMGSTVTFNNTSTPTPAISTWLVDGADVYSYNNNVLDYNFLITGTHSIQLKNTFGTCADSVSKTIMVNVIPDLKGFIANTTGICGAPVVYNFKDTTTGDVKWEWNFNSNYNNDIQSALQAPSYTYSTDGGYGVWLRALNAAGCAAVVSQYIGITKPYVAISDDGMNSVCLPVTKKFFTTSSDSITIFNWNFGDGTSSALSQPTHLFDKAGNYNITLSYVTLSGCQGTVSYGDLAVYAKPVADFVASATIACGNTPIIFEAINQGPNNYYLWDLGDNSNIYLYNNVAVNHQYSNDTTYTISLVVTNQGFCSDTIIKTNYIKVLPPFPRINGLINTCDGARGMVTLSQDSKKTTSWAWDFGDGSSRLLNADSSSITHNYLSTGSFKAVLTTTNGQCSVRDSAMVHVLLKQKPLLTATTTNVCTDGQVQVTINNLQNNPWPNNNNEYYYLVRTEYNDLTMFGGSISNNQNYGWGTNFSGTYSFFEKDKTGLRTILRSAGFGCDDTTNFIPLSIKGSVAGFGIISDHTCFKSGVVFKDSSKTTSKIISWKWDFGDNTMQVLDHGGTTSHAYANPGSYNVTLTIADTSGCTSNSNSQYQVVTVNGPKAAFNASANNSFITLPVYFTNNTNNYNSYDTRYSWSFGDGPASTDFSPTHIYNLPGQYTVTLITTNPVSGCADTTSQQVIINNFNSAFSFTQSFLTSGSCPPVLVRLSNNSINYTSVKWNFGDGNTADNLNNPAHIYENPGKYIITLYVYGPNGLTGTYIDSIIIKQPQAVIRVDNKLGCVGLNVSLNAVIKNSASYIWDLGDGSLISNNVSSVSHQYNSPGVFKPYLLLTDSGGCNTFSSLNDSIIIRKNPVVTIAPASPFVCAGQSVGLTASGGATYAWSPPAGLSNTTIASPAASPDSTTSYLVTVKDEVGCMNTGEVQVKVVQKNKVTITPGYRVCSGKTVQLSASGADNYKWIFNTTGLSNTAIPDPVANPLANTSYTVTGGDSHNCFSDTATVNVSVLPLPTVNISAVPEVLLSMPVQITSTYSIDVTEWAWSPGDYLNCLDCPSPVSTPLAAITYKLSVKNSNGCTASAEVALKLQCQESRVFIPTAFSPNNDGLNDVFSIKGISRIKHMVIYGRWGKRVYERSDFIASDRSSGWDGTYNGDPLPAGAYTYFAEMECPAGGVFVKKGTVMLVR